jgi:hypothetical protein
MEGCLVCEEAVPDTALSCGHVCLCAECAPRVWRCPLCRTTLGAFRIACDAHCLEYGITVDGGVVRGARDTKRAMERLRLKPKAVGDQVEAQCSLRGVRQLLYLAR